jgi:hypothetical protein
MERPFLLIIYISFFSLFFHTTYSWGLHYWIETEEINQTKNVKVYESLEICNKKCYLKCYSVNDYREEFKKALISMGHVFPNNKTNLLEAVCITNNNPISSKIWNNPTSPYFNMTKAINFTFTLGDICHSFCQPLYNSGCYLTNIGHDCYKEIIIDMKIPINKTESDYKLPKKFRISNTVNPEKIYPVKQMCLTYNKNFNETEKSRLNFKLCHNITKYNDDFAFYAENIHHNYYMIYHKDSNENNSTRYAMTYKRNYEPIRFEIVKEKFTKQIWKIEKLCFPPICKPDKYNTTHFFRFSAYPDLEGATLCARGSFLRKCDDGSLRVIFSQTYNITELE